MSCVIAVLLVNSGTMQYYLEGSRRAVMGIAQQLKSYHPAPLEHAAAVMNRPLHARGPGGDRWSLHTAGLNKTGCASRLHGSKWGRRADPDWNW